MPTFDALATSRMALLEAAETSLATSWKLSALAVVLVPAIAQPTIPNELSDIRSRIEMPAPEDTNTSSSTDARSDSFVFSLFEAFNSLYDTLLASSRELDPEIRKVLYESRWELYE